MKNVKSIAVLIGVVILSLALLSLTSTNPLNDGRFLLTACCLVLAEVFVWAAATSRLSAAQREFNQIAPFYLGIGVLAAIILLLSLAVVWLYIAEASYTSLVVATGLIVLMFVIGASLMLAATRVAAQKGHIDDEQSQFMQALRTNLNNLAEQVRVDSAQSATVKKALDHLCDEARFTSLPSPPGTERINDELSRGMVALEGGLVDSAGTLQQLKLMESVLKRRENIIRQLRG